ncbi:proline--tRNA ligase [Candidatus Falkowbacteria bacterium RIFOXYB2_FULL_47_14]|uniref:Proline--tRNA ligase n=1 Tax=Candidatus Falkowbacteria bacterium RIFOXYA2_FULL_47_19 TaxID=1797994 RepID=A0A1F5SHE6_9BACT|nr:MAG: proline--tRNA ligase [Candidatus Falkowbacteria bacterium RIFOXYA2_FULL_47_19]OGF34334.1 MAG: proline--tRNA ligase [Candidatus Falkowbacteria bacterium RIFOXYC2_FULL_46_15]OGF42723.1 MAG: proline--tRNA ligase [Candidatus Falkowbacteria bacterium RIFOXYB2_FULL_47_14]
MKNNKITPQKEDFPRWYQDVVKEAELAENSEVRGCGIVRPYGYKIWELIKEELNRMITSTGVENVYFPIFVPMENLEAEKDHIEGFAPELAVVTHGGGQELVNKLVVRPTSETAMYKTYARWIQSYKDLPLRLNQWNNVVRWEKRPRAFLRWSEFLWQEGHTVFADREGAIAEMWQMLDIYEKMYEYMALPVFKGRKSEVEKFAGAEITSTVEVMVRDGKAIQGGTSHYLGTNFSEVFDVKYLGEDGEKHFGHQNSWGFSWRSIGAVIMGHGDDNGLRLPPNIAPIQVVTVPIYKDENKAEVITYAEKIFSDIKGWRKKIDLRNNLTPGFKYNHWEARGVPVRLEIGPKEAADGTVTVFRRDINTKETVGEKDLSARLEKLMAEIHDNLYKQAKEFALAHIHRIESVDEIKDQVGFFEASWSEDPASERSLKERFSMVSRVLPADNQDKEPKNKKCFITGKEAKHDWLFAKSY